MADSTKLKLNSNTSLSSPTASGMISAEIINKPKTSLNNIDLPNIHMLAEHYLSWITLAMHSNYYSQQEIKQQMIDQSRIIIDILEKEGQQNLTTISNFKKNLELFIAQHEIDSIIHFGSNCTLDDYLPFKKGEPTPPITPSSKRSTTIHLGNDISHQPVEATIVEQYRTDNTGNKKFISESILPKDLNEQQLMTWARATVLSFLAAAPAGTNHLNFEDGFTRQQLEALTSFCQYMGYSYQLGKMQMMRIHLDELDPNKTQSLAPELITKIKNNAKINLNQRVIESIVDDDRASTINQLWSYQEVEKFNDNTWREWSLKNIDGYTPFLGEKEYNGLLSTLSASPTSTRVLSNNSSHLFRSRASSNTSNSSKQEESNLASLEEERPSHDTSITIRR